MAARFACAVAAIVLFSALVAPANRVSTAAPAPTLLTMEEAEILIYLLPEAHAERERGRDVSWTSETNKAYDLQDFYYFWLVGSGEPHHVGSITVGYYAVNKHTGDIWETAATQHITSPELKGVQAIIRAAHHVNASILRKYSDLRPKI